jgi:leucyl aminopeptidase
MYYLVTEIQQKRIPIIPVFTAKFETWLQDQPQAIKNWLTATGFKAKSSSYCIMGNADGEVERVFLGMANPQDTWAFGVLPKVLPEGVYELSAELSDQALYHACIAWGLGAYQFTPYKKMPEVRAKLFIPATVDAALVDNILRSVYLVRDLINTPTDDMSPADLGDVVEKLADEFGAKTRQLVGNELLEQNYPTIHTVGRGSEHEPRLIELCWGNENNPKIVLVGKGVCFDSGGLNIKPASGMLTMKKDMGGAAHAMGLARMIMQSKLPVNLRVLIPAVENSVSGNAYHPGDIITTRKGITVEVTNTDAEGRLILCDALAEAVTGNPDLLIDFATLTGAARVALGPEVAAMFSSHDDVAEELLKCAAKEQEPVWRMPLYMPYRRYLESPIADIVNAVLSNDGGGAITAALFLKEFVPATIPWVHFDIMAANPKTLPGKPEGAEADTLRTVFCYLRQRFG